MEYNRTITLDVSGQENIPTIPAKQGDINTRTIYCNLVNQNVQFKIPPTAIARISFRKPDGQQVLNDATIVDDLIYVELTEQMLTASGKAHCEIMVFNNPTNQLITSATFSVMIYPVGYNSDQIESSSEYKSFIEALLQVDDAIDRCDKATERANVSAEKADAAADHANSAADEALLQANNAKEATKTALFAAESADLAADRANTAAEKAEEVIKGNIVLFDPTVGANDKLQNILINLYTYFVKMLGNPITAGEFDEQLISVETFDARKLRVREFDQYAKDYFFIVQQEGTE